DLLSSPTSPTNGDVIVAITVTAGDTDLEISSLRWASGERDTEYFASADAGVEVSASNEFTASANGIYTVYARDNAGNEAVETITVANTYRTAPSIDLQRSPTSPTNCDVTITETAEVADDPLELT